jgi:hypothetical protein
MANQNVNTLQVYQGKSWAGLTTDNHLGTVFSEQPTLVSGVMSRVFGMYSHAGLDSILSMLGAEEELSSDADFEWYLKGDDEKAIRIVSFNATDVTRPGVNNTIFELELAEKYFAYTDKLVFDDRKFAVRVMEEPISNGVNWLYRVQLMTGDSTLFVPPALLAANRMVSKEYSPQERTLSKTAGETSFTSPFKLRNSFSTLRKTYTIPGNMHSRPLVIELLDPKSMKTTKIWTQYAEWEFMCQWYKEKNRNLIYSESNKGASGMYNMTGASGFPIIEGAGLRQQIAPAYKFNYTQFTIDWLEDVLLNLSINILPEDSRHFVALTGERGMIQFHRALENHAARFQPLDSKRISGSGQNLVFGGQYREYLGPQGIRFTLVHLPEYDNPVSNRLQHPDGGPVESYRYTILNFGTHKGKKNIRRVYPKGRKELMWHIAGSTSPLGPNMSFSKGSASAVDGYELHCMANQGLLIENPMSCAELIFAAQY